MSIRLAPVNGTSSVEGSHPSTHGWRWLQLLAVVLSIAGLVLLFALFPVTSWLVTVVEWIRGQGRMGWLFFAVAYVVAAVVLLPGAVLTIGGGFAYGPLWGLVLVSPVSVLAATTAFLLARTVARDWVVRRFGQNPRVAAIDAAVGQSGLKIVLLLRLSPLFPFNILNYTLGLTRVRLRDFVLGSWIGMLPATVLYVYIGSLITSASKLASGTRPSSGVAGHALLVAGLVATVAVIVVFTRIARKALKNTLNQVAAPKEQSS
jgi:uncharacterized membrane protein YdjX (TVP38/TMEM64 family)